MALKENNPNEEPTTGAVAIQIVLAMATCLPTIAYRILMDGRSNSHQRYGLIMDPLTHSPTVATLSTLCTWFFEILSLV